MANDQKMLNEIAEQVNKVLQKTGWSVSAPRWRYWRAKIGNRRTDKYAYCYTTERCGDGKFYALVYRITRECWKMTKKVAFGRRKKAKEKAYKWYCQRKEKLQRSMTS